MKRLFTLFLLLSIFSLNVLADPISAQAAKQVGQTFMSKSVSASGMLKAKKQYTNWKLIYTAEALQISSSGQATVPFYIFGGDSEGYVIVAGDDRVIPILGYADNGVFDPNNIPPNMQKWLEGYKSEIRYVNDNNITASPETKAAWHALNIGESMNVQNMASSVAPLITTKWDQSPYYNDLCPYDNTKGEKAVTGCVATAMAQVLKFWNYPVAGSGFHSYNHATYGTLSANFGSTTYDWTNMPNQLTSTSSSAQKSAVATLMYHCGVSVDMNYGVDASSAYTIGEAPSAEDALKTYFGYKTTLSGKTKSNYTDANWIDLLKSEINVGRPIIYAGRGTEGGHCFVCDGYDSNNYFHFNWGWAGQNDGYYSLSALSPGSGGAGGGSYTFTDDQRAIVGIEPANGGTSTQSFDLQLNSNLTMSKSRIWFIDPFDLTVDITNKGTGNFSGQFGAAVFDSLGNFIDFIETKSDMTLSANSHFTSGLTFNNAGSPAFVPGKYKAAIFYKTATQDWTIVANGSYSNFKQFEIYYSSVIEVNSAFTLTTDEGKLIQGKDATVNVDVKNTGSTTFYGKLRVDLANLDGSWAQDIKVFNVDNGLNTNYHYTTGINFTGTITVEPGTYLMEVAYQSQGSSDWYYAGSSKFSNPVYVIVEAPVLIADIYEDNNAQSKAYKLPVSYSGSSASVNTNGSSLHLGTDIDYYKIELPSGYNYTITPRLHDNFDSGNGQYYSVDALFSYSTNGITYSETYDAVMAGKISIYKGGTVYFKVAPYFSGNTGTYLLDLGITRNTTTGVEDIETAQISLYPTPAKDFVTIDGSQFEGKINQIVFYDVQGKQIKSIDNPDNIIKLPLEDVSNGVYVVKIVSDKGILSKKIIVRK